MSGNQSKYYSTFTPAIVGVIAAFMVILISVKYGLAMSPDSACYLSIADNLVKGNGFAIYDFTPAVHWPPLYPLALAVGDLFNFDLSDWARVLNALIFGLILFFSSRWILDKVENRVLGIVGVLAVLFSMPLFYVAKHVWSETMFIFFITLFLIRLEKSFSQQTLKDVLFLGVLAALACLTKYLGLTLVLLYCIWLLQLKTNFKQKLTNALTFSAVAITPLLFWIWRNYQVSGTLTGSRSSSSTPFTKNFLILVDSVSQWFLPKEFSPYTRAAVVGVLLMLGIALYFWTNSKIIAKEGLPQVLWVNWGFTAIYVACLLTASSLVTFDSIDFRFNSIIYIPFIVSTTYITDQIIKNAGRPAIVIKVIVLVLATGWLYYIGDNTIADIKKGYIQGAGSFSTDFWRNSNFAGYLAKYEPEGKLYSNFPDGVYLLSGLSAHMSPRRHIHRSPDELAGDLKVLAFEFEKADAVYLAWFTKSSREFQHTPEELMLYFDLQEIVNLPNGIVYKISSHRPTENPK